MNWFATSRTTSQSSTNAPLKSGCDRASEREDRWYGLSSPIGGHDDAYVAPWPINRIIEKLVQWQMRRRAHHTIGRWNDSFLARITASEPDSAIAERIRTIRQRKSEPGEPTKQAESYGDRIRALLYMQASSEGSTQSFRPPQPSTDHDPCCDEFVDRKEAENGFGVNAVSVPGLYRSCSQGPRWSSCKSSNRS